MKPLLLLASIGLCLTSTSFALSAEPSPETEADKQESAELGQISALDEPETAMPFMAGDESNSPRQQGEQGTTE
jgi:hypothetical protein